MLIKAWSINVNGQPVLQRNNKARALLTYLAIHPNHPFTREHLQTLLWSDSDAKRGRISLRKTLSQINKVLPVDFVQVDGQLLSIGRIPFTLDLDQIRANPLDYTTPAINAIGLPNASGWDEWLLPFCERLELDVLAKLETLGRDAMATGEHDAAIRYATHALTLDEWREQTHQLLIEAYWRAGDRMAAQAQYDRCAEILRDELGVEPSAETQHLLARLKTSPATIPNNLPPEETLTDFVGRTQEIAEIVALLQQPKPRLLTLMGLGGIGKTRLALACARVVYERFPAGAYWLDLTSIDATMIVNTLAATLDVQLQGQAAPLDQLIDVLRERHALLIFDNFETVLESDEAITLVQRILSDAPRIKLLVTSRERLSFRLEQVVAVDGMALSADHDDDEPHAVKLFTNVARRAQLRFQDKRADILNICRLVEGMPLAIEMAAAWTPTMRCAEIAAEIERNLAILRAQYHDIPARQRSLIVVFEATWRRLSAEQQATLLRLTVFPSHFTVDAAETIAGADRPMLDIFVRRTLLSWHSAERLRFHQRLRQFLQAKRDATVVQPTIDRHSRYFADWLEAIKSELGGQRQVALLNAIGEEVDNIHAAWNRSSAAQRADRLNQMVGSFQYFLMTRGRYHESYDYLDRALQQFEMSQPLENAQIQLLHRLHLARANASMRLGHVAEADQHFRFALAAAERLGDDQSYAQALSMFGYFLSETGAYDEALAMLKEAVALHANLSEPTTELHAYNTLGIVHKALGEFAAARAAYDHCLALAERTGNDRARAYVLNNIGVIYQEEGNADAAERYYQQALPLFATLRDRRMTGMTSNNMGNIFLDKGAFVEAESWYQRGLDAIADTGEQWVRGLLLLNRGHAVLEQERLADAENALEEARTIFTNIKEKTYAAMAFGKLGRLAIKRADLSTAAQLLRQGVQIADERQSPSLLLQLVAEWTMLLQARGQERERIAILKGIAAVPNGIGEGVIYAHKQLAALSPADVADIRSADIATTVEQIVSG